MRPSHSLVLIQGAWPESKMLSLGSKRHGLQQHPAPMPRMPWHSVTLNSVLAPQGDEFQGWWTSIPLWCLDQHGAQEDMLEESTFWIPLVCFLGM